MKYLNFRKIAWLFVGMLFLLVSCEPASDTTNSIEEANTASQTDEPEISPESAQIGQLGIVFPEADALLQEGISFVEQGNYESAIQSFDQAIEINPDFVEAYVQRGRTYLFLERQFEARTDAEKAIEINVNYAESYFLRASIFYSEGSLQFALDDLNRFIELTKEPVSEDTLEFKEHIEELIDN